MSITISVTFLSTLCNQNTGTAANKFDITKISAPTPRKQKINDTKLETETERQTAPSCPPPTAGSNLYLFFSAVEEEMKINDKIRTQTIKQNERPPTN